MEGNMKKIIALVLTLIMCTGMLAACGGSDSTDSTGSAASSDDDTVYNLVVTNSDSSTSMCEEYLETLFGQITEASGGRLTFTYQPGGSLFAATETLDAVESGACDIGWTSTAFYAQRFPIAEFINLCANGITSAQMGTDVFEAMIEEIPEAAEEFSSWKIVATYACAEAPVCYTGDKIETAEDFQGVMLRAAGTVASQYIEALGATPVSLATSEVYEAVEKGTLQGFCNDWHNIDCFNLYECIDYCMTLPINFTACTVIMNWDTYNSLPSDLQEILDTYCGNYAADMAGYWWDSCRYWVGDEMEENGVEIYEPSDELYEWATSDEVVGDIHEWYVSYLEENGYDNAQEIYDTCCEIVERYTEEHANDLDEEFNYTDWAYDADTYTETDPEA